MIHELGLIATISVCAWLSLDLLAAEGWRRRSVSIGVLGIGGVIWAGADLLIAPGRPPEELAALRKALHLGAWAVSLAWFWIALEAAAPEKTRRNHRLVAMVSVPAAALYATIFLAPGLLIDPLAPTPRHGPLFPVSLGYAWVLTTIGMVNFARAAYRLRRSPIRAAAMLGGILIPLIANVIYSKGYTGPIDPTPAVLAPAALMIRYAVIETGMALFLPLARSDVIEQLDVGILVTDNHDRVVDANRAAHTLLGAETISGELLTPIVDTLDVERRRCLEIHRFVLRGSVEPIGAALVLTDRSEAVQTEQRLQLASRLEALGSLTAGISHEVNNPLSFVSANLAELERMRTELEKLPEPSDAMPWVRQHLDEVGELLSDSREGIERIALLVARLRGFATDPTAETEVDLSGASRTAVLLAGVGQPEGSIALDAPEDLPVWTNEGAVVQIVVNLILNALQASRDRLEIEVAVSTQDGEAVVSVGDRGEGIQDDLLERIFDPFYTSKPTGTGLGLSIGYDLAAKLGGRLEAGNRPGGGAIFSLHLPRNAPRSS
jgi:signal transduction histidine kinase